MLLSFVLGLGFRLNYLSILGTLWTWAIFIVFFFFLQNCFLLKFFNLQSLLFAFSSIHLTWNIGQSWWVATGWQWIWFLALDYMASTQQKDIPSDKFWLLLYEVHILFIKLACLLVFCFIGLWVWIWYFFFCVNIILKTTQTLIILLRRFFVTRLIATIITTKI